MPTPDTSSRLGYVSDICLGTTLLWSLLRYLGDTKSRLSDHFIHCGDRPDVREGPPQLFIPGYQYNRRLRRGDYICSHIRISRMALTNFSNGNRAHGLPPGEGIT